MQGVLPLLGGLMLLGRVRLGVKTYAARSTATRASPGSVACSCIGVGSLLGGVVLMFIYQAIRPVFFTGATLPRRDASELVLVSAGMEGPTLRLPDSGEEPTVIAADLSNLPPGQTAIDPVTGERFKADGDPRP